MRGWEHVPTGFQGPWSPVKVRLRMIKSEVIGNGKAINGTARLLNLKESAVYLGISTDCLRSM